eukprot:symbB.v1.2.005093.t1/scaffold234.1/size257806/12
MEDKEEDGKEDDKDEEKEAKDEEMPAAADKPEDDEDDDDDDELEKIEEPQKIGNASLGLGQSYLECSCWEHQVLRLEAPVDGLGRVHVLSAWFGHPTREDLRVDVTEELRAVAARSDASIHVSAANLGVAGGAYSVWKGSRSSGSKPVLRKLTARCCYRWLDEAAEKMCTLLAEQATEEVHAADARLADLHQKLTENENGPLLPSIAEHQLQILQLQSASSLALEGLLYLAEHRPRVFISAAASITSHGFPFAYFACRAAQSLARALRLSSVCAPDGLASACASKAEVRDFMQQCSQHGTQLVFERLFGEFFKHVHAEWLADSFSNTSVGYLHQLIQVAHEELLDLLSRHAKDSRHRIEEEILRADALREAAELAFCPLCLRPLQQFPDEVGAVVDGLGRRLESTLYHRRCVFHLADGWCGAGGCDATWTAQPPPLLMQKTGAAQGWWPLPPLTAFSDWARFVASGACLSRPFVTGSSFVPVPMEQVAVTLAASLPVHAKQFLWDLQRFHTCRDGEASFVQDLKTLESIAAWALQQVIGLDWWGVPPLAFLVDTSLEQRLTWFCHWDIEKTGHLSCGALALALGSAVRMAADFNHVILADPLEEVLPLLCALGGLQRISSGRFLSEVAASASKLLRRHLSPQQPESIATTPSPDDLPKEDHRHVADAEKAQCRLTFIGTWAAGVLNADTPEVRAYKGHHHKSSQE